MNGITVVQAALESTRGLLKWFIDDFSDADLFVRPAPRANHMAWQIGNVIGGDIFLLKGVFPNARFPDLPPGFAELHGSAGAAKDGPEGFLNKAEYIALFDAVRSAVIDFAGTLTDHDLDKPTSGDMAKFAPRICDLFLLVANHTIMHAGQATVIRRILGKPVLF